ncbi:MAG TPA: dihydropyrimidinase [Cellulomonas sp.]
MSRVLVRGGTVVTAADTVLAEVLIDGETVLGVVSPGSQTAIDFARGADRVIEAAGCYVVPGGIDAHTHFESVGQPEAPVLDTFETGTIASAYGGTTTVIDFAGPRPDGGQRLQDAVAWYHDKASASCAVDYAFHVMVQDVDDQTPLDMDELVREGVTSFKMFTAYAGRSYSPDDRILRMLQQSTRNGGLIMMHAENGFAIELLRDQAVERGDVDPVWHSLTRPPILEAEAVHRVAALAEVAGAPLYVVHVSSGEAVNELARARDRGTTVFAETCPQYLFLDLDDLREPGFGGAKYVCSPPLRAAEQQNGLWRGLANHDLHTVATDHCPFCWAQKEIGRGDFRSIPNGIPGVEHRVEQMYEGAVLGGRLSLNRWVDVCSTAPARLFGMYPRKGTIAPGADADIVVFDPQAPHVISAATHHMNVDYSAYEGQLLHGKVRTVLVRGSVVVEDDAFVGRSGYGRFVRRDVGDYLL